MATRIKRKCQVMFKYVGTSFIAEVESWRNLESVLSRSPTLTSFLRVKSIFRVAPQITAKSPKNAPETQALGDNIKFPIHSFYDVPIALPARKALILTASLTLKWSLLGTFIKFNELASFRKVTHSIRHETDILGKKKKQKKILTFIRF